MASTSARAAAPSAACRGLSSRLPDASPQPFNSPNLHSRMSQGRILRALAWSSAAALVVLILLAFGLEVERQVDPVRMRTRLVTTFFGAAISHGTETPLDFALRFPSAVQNRESQAYWSS